LHIKHEKPSIYLPKKYQLLCQLVEYWAWLDCIIQNEYVMETKKERFLARNNIE
jgi:hypothetical protein